MIDLHCIFDHCYHGQELTHDELDLVIKAQHLAHTFYGQHTRAKYLEKEKKSIKRTFSMNYTIADTHFVFCPWY